MKYVLDSSVAVKWALTEAQSDKAVKLRDDNHPVRRYPTTARAAATTLAAVKPNSFISAPPGALAP